MKVLKSLFACLVIGCTGLLCHDDDLIKLTRALQELTRGVPPAGTEQHEREQLERLKEKQEKLEREQLGEKLGKGMQKKPFATHFLLIIADTSESGEQAGAMATEVGQAFVNNVPFLTTEGALGAFVKTSKQKNLPTTYRYFKIPPNQMPRFALCIPANTIPSTMIPVADEEMRDDWIKYTPKTVSIPEQKSGLLLEHFSEITEKITAKNYELAQFEGAWMGVELRAILHVLFVPNSAYKNPDECPRWAIIFSGHGRQYLPYSDKDILKKHTFIYRNGAICDLDMENFSATIRMLHEKITLALVHISTCFGGGINIGSLLNDEKTGVMPPYPFIITTATITGDSCVEAKKDERFDLFQDQLNGIEIYDVEKLMHTPSFWQSSESIRSVYDFALKKLYTKTDGHNAIERALSYIQPSQFVIFPAIKPAATNYFIELNLVGSDPLERIDVKTIEKHLKNKSSFVAQKKGRVLVYVNSVPFTIKGEPGLMGIFSAIPGSTFHIFEKIEPSIAPTYKAMLPMTLRDLMQETKGVTKLFHIKDWISSLEGNYKVWVIKKDDDYECLTFPDQKDGKDFALSHGYVRKSTKTTREIISKKEAAAWIKKFDDKIVFLKKLANAQAPYRFLKDAQIETLPWDA